MSSDVLFFEGEPLRGVDGDVLLVSDYVRRLSGVEESLLGLYGERGLDVSGLVLFDSEDSSGDGRFVWPIVAVDRVSGSQGVCDLFSGGVEEQALFLFEQLMELY